MLSLGAFTKVSINLTALLLSRESPKSKLQNSISAQVSVIVTKIMRFYTLISDLCVRRCPRNTVDTKGGVKKINTYCHCHFNGHISKQLEDDLNGGSLKSLTLISSNLDSIVGYDAQNHKSMKEFKISIQIDKGNILKSGGNYKYMGLIKNNDAKAMNMESIKISFKDDGDIYHTAEIDTNTGKLINSENYVKKIKITDFKDFSATSVGQIYKPIITKMLEHI
ncbi:hypothetical protein [Bathymodiolus japonicus methanotrophic gill symbiont]|uniref:hypothetical protein n=1 Tax=Bathymodiolus japonicus methanotrophic gill symbiont TaxID=113269 RepID=UPI001C8DDEDC|nr:hypothetical protein [Bathymodiolus japonicus methanotrophic gill symbiont]